MASPLSEEIPEEIPQIEHSELTDLEAVGQGGYGVVYRAKHGRFGTVVYKELNTQILGERVSHELQKEAKMFTLHHINIVALHAVILELGHYGFVMEYVLHGSLDDFMFTYYVDWPLKLSFAHGIVCGMNYLHSLRPPVIHSDLKIENVLISDKLEAKICDFGLAKWKELAATQTTEGRRRGTIAYMAPEVFRDVSTPRTVKYDVYSFGVLLWELLSEKKPFEYATTDEQVRTAAMAGNRPPLDEVVGPDDLLPFAKKWIVQSWHELPDERPSFDDLERKFLEIRQDQAADHLERKFLEIRQDQAAEHLERKFLEIRQDQAAEQLERQELEGATQQEQVTGSHQLMQQQLKQTDDTEATSLQMTLNGHITELQQHPLPRPPTSATRLITSFNLNYDKKQKPLRQGHYGDVLKGLYTDENGRIQDVAIKRLKKTMYEKFASEFENEFSIMVNLQHASIVGIIGRSIEQNALLLVMEFVSNGCLRDYLKKNNKTTPDELLRFSLEIVEGMVYLTSKKIVHRELAARNVLVSDDNPVHMKISGFGRSRALGNETEYEDDRYAIFPFLWCAPEVLRYRRFDEKSDVWSYGVTMWEIYSYGDAPMLGEIDQLLRLLHDGQRLRKPAACPLVVFKILYYGCWEYEQMDRKTFVEIRDQLKAELDKQSSCQY